MFRAVSHRRELRSFSGSAGTSAFFVNASSRALLESSRATPQLQVPPVAHPRNQHTLHDVVIVEAPSVQGAIGAGDSLALGVRAAFRIAKFP
jgi:hypothetical protein